MLRPDRGRVVFSCLNYEFNTKTNSYLNLDGKKDSFLF